MRSAPSSVCDLVAASPAKRLIAATAVIHEEAPKTGKTIADQWLEEGMRKGEAKGRTKGRVELLLRQLRVRFGAIPAHAEAALRGADVDTLDRWGEQMLTASNLDEALA